MAQGLTLATFVLQRYMPMLEKIRNTAPPMTPGKIGNVWTFGELLSVLDNVPEPGVEWGGGESEPFFLWGANFGPGGFAEGCNFLESHAMML